MKNMKFFSLAALLMAGAAFTACSSDNDIIDEQHNQTANASGKYTFTIKAAKGDNANSRATRALAVNGDDIAATWTAGDQVTVYNETKKAALGGYLEAETSGIETTLTGDLTGTIEEGDMLTLKFLSANYNNQQGTLAYIAANCDYATASVTVSRISGSTIVPVAAETEFTNQQAIVKFSLRDSNGSGLPNHTSKLLVIVDKSTIYTVNPANQVNDIYVALPAISNKTITLSATVGSSTYVYTKTGVTFANGEFYAINPVKMQIGATTLTETISNQTGNIVTVSYGFASFDGNCTFISNGDGTFSYLSGGYSYGAKALVVEDGKLVFKQNFYSTLDYDWSVEGFSVTFDPSDNTYYVYQGSGIAIYDDSGFNSLTVNGQTISLTEVDPPAQAIITFADLDTDGCSYFYQIVQKNSSLIYFDDDERQKVKRRSDNAALKCANKDHPEHEDYVFGEYYEYNPKEFNYYFEGDGGGDLSAALVDGAQVAVQFTYDGSDVTVSGTYDSSSPDKFTKVECSGGSFDEVIFLVIPENAGTPYDGCIQVVVIKNDKPIIFFINLANNTYTVDNPMGLSNSGQLKAFTINGTDISSSLTQN